MTRERWQASLESVRRRFESAADQYDGVTCVLIHWGARDLPVAERLHGYPHRFFGSGKPADGGMGSYRVKRLGRRKYLVVTREHFYLCRRNADREGAAVFERQATEAARYLAEIPKSIFSQVSIPSLKRHELSNTAATRWVWFLFDLAWQQAPDSPRHTQRTIWGLLEGEDRSLPESVVCLPHDKAAISRYREEHGDGGGKLPFLAKWAERLPNRYFSAIPDVFAFSAWAVNTILPVETVPPPPPPKTWEPRRTTKRVIEDLKKGLPLNEIVEEHDVSAKNVRQIRCRARKHGLLPPKKAQ